MSLGSTYISGTQGPDFHLPDEILSVIPADPYDQLDLARKITSMAITSRVSNLESDMIRMREKMHEKDSVICKFEEKVAQLERAYAESESRLKDALDQNSKLVKERDSLAASARKLNRDLMKMETFKRQLIQSLSDEDSSQNEAVEIGTRDQPVAKNYSLKENRSSQLGVRSSLNTSSINGGSIITDDCFTEGNVRNSMQKFSITPYITPKITPTSTPKVISTSGSPKGQFTPEMISGATSPTKSHFEGRPPISSWYAASSQQSSAANSPPRTRQLAPRTPRIDGKEFFRQARSRLSYEQFSAFLANIKELNAQKQSREETLRRTDEIFGAENKDLYVSFHGLLHRQQG